MKRFRIGITVKKLNNLVCLWDYSSSIILFQGEHTLRTEDILAAIETHGDTTALICLPGVHYFTGQLFDIPTITAAAHDKVIQSGNGSSNADLLLSQRRKKNFWSTVVWVLGPTAVQSRKAVGRYCLLALQSSIVRIFKMMNDEFLLTEQLTSSNNNSMYLPIYIILNF